MKGYDWFVLNHEQHREVIAEHYSTVLCLSLCGSSRVASCSFLNSVVANAPTLLDESIIDQCADASLPLDLALYPVHLLCSAFTVAFQLQSVPSNIIAGMQVMSDAILGHGTEGQDQLSPFCCSGSVSVLRTQLLPYRTLRCGCLSPDSAIYRLIKGPVNRQFRLLQTVRDSDEKDPVLWYQCETAAHSPQECTSNETESLVVSEERWLDLSETRGDACVACLLSLCGECLVSDQDAEGVLAMLSTMYVRREA